MDISNALSSSIAGQIDQANLSVGEGSLADAMRAGSSKDAGKKFEAMLGTMLAKEMRKGLDEGFFGSGPGADSFSGWLDEYVGQVMAEQGLLGTGDLVNQYAAEFEEAQNNLTEQTDSTDETEVGS